MTHRGDMGEEGVKLLVSVEDTLLCQIIGRLDRTHTLAPRLLIDRLDTAIRRDRRVVRSVRGHCHPQDWVDSSITLHTDSLPLRARLEVSVHHRDGGLSHADSPLDGQAPALVTGRRVVPFVMTPSFVMTGTTSTRGRWGEAVRSVIRRSA